MRTPILAVLLLTATASATVPIGAASPDLVVYESGFDAGAGTEWSDPTTDVTPSGRPFLGRFSADTVRLTLEDLPGHTGVRVEFDAYIILSWDGAGTQCCGVDVFDVREPGKDPLVRTTFSNTGPGNKQHYPNPLGGDLNAARTGSAERHTLGYTGSGDTVYRFDFSFAHGGDLVLDFSGEGLQGISDESWGIDTVRVTLTGVDTEAPTVQIVSPSGHVTIADQSLTAPVDVDARIVVGAVTVRADASDAGSGVRDVAFLVDGAVRFVDAEAPYEFVWDSSGEATGEHTVTAIATDVALNSAESSITVTTLGA